MTAKERYNESSEANFSKSMASFAVQNAQEIEKISPDLFFLQSGEAFVPYSRNEAKLVQHSLSEIIEKHYLSSAENGANVSPKYVTKLVKYSADIVKDTEIYRSALLNPAWVEKRKKEADGTLTFKVNKEIRKFRFTANILADYMLFDESLHTGMWPQPVEAHNPNSYQSLHRKKVEIVNGLTDEEYVKIAEHAYISFFIRGQFHRNQIEEAKQRFTIVPKILNGVKYR